jgi:hypothetical protein
MDEVAVLKVKILLDRAAFEDELAGQLVEVDLAQEESDVVHNKTFLIFIAQPALIFKGFSKLKTPPNYDNFSV